MVSSRQNSCSACVRGKRRCDLGFPQCGRCLARSVSCVYTWMSPEDTQEIESSDVVVWNDRAESTRTSRSHHESFTPEVDLDISPFPTPVTIPAPLVPLIDEITGRGRAISLFTPDPRPQYPSPSSQHSQMLYMKTTISTPLLPSQRSRMYQCMRLFSDDSSQKVQAEQDTTSLNKWIDILQPQTPGIPSTSSKLDQSWETWIRAESVQRTMIFADLVESSSTFLKYGWYQPSPRLGELTFIGHTSIWNARSLTEWRQAGEQHTCLILKMSRFQESVKRVCLDDLDELGIMILVVYEGFEVLRRWTGDDKKMLEKWGLSFGGNNPFE